MHSILRMLEGGDRRSIGRSDEVVAMVLACPGLFGTLISGIALADPLIRMRCADAAEKISALHPDWLHPYKRVFLEDYSGIGQAEVRHACASQTNPALRTQNASPATAGGLLLQTYACMRASPLTKEYGWGAHYDELGKLQSTRWKAVSTSA